MIHVPRFIADIGAINGHFTIESEDVAPSSMVRKFAVITLEDKRWEREWETWIPSGIDGSIVDQFANVFYAAINVRLAVKEHDASRPEMNSPFLIVSAANSPRPHWLSLTSSSCELAVVGSLTIAYIRLAYLTDTALYESVLTSS